MIFYVFEKVTYLIKKNTAKKVILLQFETPVFHFYFFF